MAIIGSVGTDPAFGASSFAIQELSGDRRLLLLIGRALPYRPIELSGTMRAVVTYYAGNPIGTIQVLGASEEPTTLTGYWKDRFIGSVDSTGRSVENSGLAFLDNTRLDTVRTLVDAVNDMRLKGQLLEVRWDEQTRHGVLTKFTVKWHNPHDAEWEMQFTWISRGEPDAPPVFTEVDQQDIASEVASKSAALVTTLASVDGVFPVIDQWIEDVDAARAQIEAASDSMRSTVANVVDKAASPLDAATRTIGLLEFAASEATGLMRVTQTRVYRAIVQPSFELLSVGQCLSASLYARDSRDAARDVRATGIQRAHELRTKTGSRATVAQFYARADTDLRDVSTKFYGTPNEWRRIAEFNGLNRSQLSAGQLVLVPPAQVDSSRTA